MLCEWWTPLVCGVETTHYTDEGDKGHEKQAKDPFKIG